MTNRNDWGVDYSQITFMEGALRGHQQVLGFERQQDIFFIIRRNRGLSTVKMLLVEEYTLGLAAVLKARREFPDLDCIVTGSSWNAYTREAKEFGKQAGVGVYVVGEFFGALWKRDVSAYVKKDDRGKPVYRYRSA